MKFNLLTGGQEIRLAILTFLVVILSFKFIFLCFYPFLVMVSSNFKIIKLA